MAQDTPKLNPNQLTAERVRFSKWRTQIPDATKERWAAELGKDFKQITAIEAIGRLKHDGHIRSITLVNAPPRTVSTIITKVIAESPSLNLQGLPVVHEVLNNSGKTAHWPDPDDLYKTEIKTYTEADGFAGSDVLMGKLIDSGILQKKGADFVTKIMSHEFTGDHLRAFLPYVDNVLSTVRHPSIHIGCIQSKVAQECEHDFNYQVHLHEPIVEYWKGFSDNIRIIDEHVKRHPGTTKHLAINGDAFLFHPEEVTRDEICKAFNMEYSPKMLDEMKAPVYFSRVDTWGKSEIVATRFNMDKRHDVPAEPRKHIRSYQEYTYNELEPMFEAIAEAHPHIREVRGAGAPGASAARILDRRHPSDEIIR